MHFRKIGIKSGIYFWKIGKKSGIQFGKIDMRNRYVFETSMARPRPKSGQAPPPPRDLIKHSILGTSCKNGKLLKFLYATWLPESRAYLACAANKIMGNHQILRKTLFELTAKELYDSFLEGNCRHGKYKLAKQALLALGTKLLL